jgi:hypothetical protein
MKIQKPKIGSKVLCIAESTEWQEMTAFPPKIGWVYLVYHIQKMNADLTDIDPKGKRLVIGLVGLGKPKKKEDNGWLFSAEFFRVVGKGKFISAK